MPRSGPRPRKPARRDRPTPEAPFELRLKDMAHGGRALGSYQGRMVFVPYTIPGELVRVRVTQERGRTAFAEGLTLLEASADRVYPRCEHFGPGRCWGCQWQHISYRAQLALKHDVLADQLARVGGFPDAVIDKAMRPTLPAPAQWGYNHHMTLERSPDGALGLRRIDGRSIEPVQQCHILHPELLELYSTLELDYSSLVSLGLQVGSDGGLMLVLGLAAEEAPALEADLALSVNVLLPDNEPVNLIGQTYTLYRVAEHDFRVTAGAFFRANVPQVAALAQQALAMLELKGDEELLDLYGGVGVFSAFMAARAAGVTLVESYPPAATDAEANLADHENVDIIEGTVEEVLAAFADEGAYYDAALVDPPPTGLGEKALNALLALKPARIVYISSDPAALARDGQRLARAGYGLRRVQPVDLAPQTYYIDAVACFVRRQGP